MEVSQPLQGESCLTPKPETHGASCHPIHNHTLTLHQAALKKPADHYFTEGKLSPETGTLLDKNTGV